MENSHSLIKSPLRLSVKASGVYIMDEIVQGCLLIDIGLLLSISQERAH